MEFSVFLECSVLVLWFWLGFVGRSWVFRAFRGLFVRFRDLVGIFLLGLEYF